MPTFMNGKIFTGIDATSFVSAMTIENGQVTWTGNSKEVNDLDAIDLKSQTVLPGLIDVHTHPKYIADALHGVACTPPDINSIEDMKTALRKSPAFGKGADTWIEDGALMKPSLLSTAPRPSTIWMKCPPPSRFLSTALIVTRPSATLKRWN